jgi:hypothetical protein
MMQMKAPPCPPSRVAQSEGDGLRHGRFQRWQILWTLITVLITTWFCTLGWVPAILALMVAKHILVAILVVGLGVDKSEPVDF